MVYASSHVRLNTCVGSGAILCKSIEARVGWVGERAKDRGGGHERVCTNLGGTYLSAQCVRCSFDGMCVALVVFVYLREQ